MENAVAIPFPISLRDLAQNALRHIAEAASPSENVRVHTVFDQDSDHYLLVAEGWQGYRRVYRTLAHIALREECVHIYEDGTVEGVAERLQMVGVPQGKIVCEWSMVPTVLPNTIHG